MKRTDLLRTVLTSKVRSVIIESGSPVKSKQILIDLLKDIHCHYSLDSHCDKCKDCKRISKLEQNIHPDLIYFGGSLFTIDKARQLIRLTESSPMEWDKRYVVFDTDKYSPESQNSILKLLEEDSDFEANTQFIFIVRSSSLLLSTINSRSLCITLQSNSVREFEGVVLQKQFQKKEFVAYICSYKEVNFHKAIYIKEKFNLDVQELTEKITKMYGSIELTSDFFTTLEDLRAFPYLFVFKTIEYLYIVNSAKNVYRMQQYYKLFYKDNYNRSKYVKDNLSTMLKIWYFINKKDMFEKYYKAAI